MVLYEVNVVVDREILGAWRAWLTAHVDEIIALPGFLGATIVAWEEADVPEDSMGATITYRVRDRASLDAYLADHAPRLRADGEDRFGGRFRAWRRIGYVDGTHTRLD